MSPIVIRTYQPSDQLECEKLFTEVHRLYNHPMFYIDDVLTTDMNDIEKNYLQVPNGHWWVAVSTENNRIVGQVAILPLSNGDPNYYKRLPEGERDQICELRRMAVSTDVQRAGVGNKLLSTLTNFAREKGYRQVHLTTLSSMHKAGPFYEKNGFTKGQLDRYRLDDDIAFQQVKNLADLHGKRLDVVTFQLDDILPEEDLPLMKMSPNESNRMYVQHYNLIL